MEEPVRLSPGCFFFSSRRRHTRCSRDWSSACALPIYLPGMVELARDAFAVPVRAGTPEQGISGLVDSVQAPRYAVPVGLVLYAARRLAQGGVPGGSVVKSAGVERWFGPLKRWLQDFF